MDDSIAYHYKGNRAGLEALYEQRGTADDIIIIKNGFVTDSFWSNLLFRKDERWYTSDTPLLRGTMRQHLLDEQKIESRKIRYTDLKIFDAAMTINALNPFDERKAISVDNIIGLK